MMSIQYGRWAAALLQDPQPRSLVPVIVGVAVGGAIICALLIWLLISRARSKKAFPVQDDFVPDLPPMMEQGSMIVSQSAPPPPTPSWPSEQQPGLQFLLETGAVKTFQSLPISIGRSDQNDLVVDDETVSSKHARIYYDQKARAICILDLDSLNGLFVNDQPTRRNVLNDGDRIRLGNAVLSFRDTGYRQNENV